MAVTDEIGNREMAQSGEEKPPKPNLSRRKRAFTRFITMAYTAAVHVLQVILFLVLSIIVNVNWVVSLLIVTVLGVATGFVLKKQRLFFVFQFLQFFAVLLLGIFATFIGWI